MHPELMIVIALKTDQSGEGDACGSLERILINHSW